MIKTAIVNTFQSKAINAIKIDKQLMAHPGQTSYAMFTKVY